MTRSTFICACFLGITLGCNKTRKPFDIRALPMDSSVTIIMETTGLLRKPCLPDCWPRNFLIKKSPTQYIAYIQKSIYSRETEKREQFVKSKSNFPEVDSTFYSLIDDATVNYKTVVKNKLITIRDIILLSNSQVKVGLINGLKEKLEDSEIGYIQLSPVIINKREDKGVYFYKLQGEINSSWLVCIQKKKDKWILVSKSRLSIS